MTYFTINMEIEEDLTPSEILQIMKDGATYLGTLVGQSPKTRLKIINQETQYYMKVGYAD